MKSERDILSDELKATERAIELEKYKTALKKAKFIDDIKNGLGQQIKNNPNQLTIIKKPWYKKIFAGFKKIFTKF